MIDYRLTEDAERDIIGIYLYTVRQFGAVQADRYTAGLEERFVKLAARPGLGRAGISAISIPMDGGRTMSAMPSTTANTKAASSPSVFCIRPKIRHATSLPTDNPHRS